MSDLEATPEMELSILKERADKMGIKYSPNIGAATLANKIEAVLEAKEKAEASNKKTTLNEKRKQIRNKALRLIRVRITCLNPNKNNLPGEIITVANAYIGTVRKFIPFNPEMSVNGYHIPYCILQHLKSRTFQQIQTVKNSKGQEVVRVKDVPEYAIEELPQLTPAELKKLAAAQLASNATGE